MNPFRRERLLNWRPYLLVGLWLAAWLLLCSGEALAGTGELVEQFLATTVDGSDWVPILSVIPNVQPLGFAHHAVGGLLTLLFLLLLPIGRALAATYYVRTGGNDGNSGTSAGNAWETFDKATSSTSAGDVVYFGSGLYEENVQPSVDGTNGSPIRFIGDTTGTFTGDPAGTITLESVDDGKNSIALEVDDDDYLEFEDITILSDNDEIVEWKNSVGGKLTNCELSDSKKGVAIEGSEVDFVSCTINNNSDKGMQIKNSSTVTITDSTISSNSKSGIKVDDSTVSILRCTFQNNGEHGLELKEGNTSITNCLIIENGKAGIELGKESATTATLWHCTIADNDGCGVLSGTDGKGGPEGGDVTITSSIIADNKEFGLSLVGGTMTHTYNVVHGNTDGDYDGTAAGTGETSSDPLFVDPTNDDYLINIASPAYNSAVDSSGVIVDDLRSSPRPVNLKWDMGCYEVQPGEGGLSAGVRILRWVETR